MRKEPPGEDGFIFHNLRHTFTTYMRKAGVDRSVIMGITGHKTEAMFHRYNTVDQEDKREAVGKLEKYLKGAGKEILSNPLAENMANR